MENKLTDKKILKLVDTFDECAMLYFDATTNDLIESTSVSNYNVERPHTNFYECLIKVVSYFLDGTELNLHEEKVVFLANSSLKFLLLHIIFLYRIFFKEDSI